MPQAPLHGSFWRPDLSFDGRKIVFCFKPHNEKSFHLYEINADGTGLRQLTDGPFDDLDPIYLPDGAHPVLAPRAATPTSAACRRPTPSCWPAATATAATSISSPANNEPDYLPSVMNDGRVIYTRWEYTDKPLWRAQKLWTINPDGTQVNTFWGNQSVWPDVIKDARSIPGSRRVMFTGSAHHNWFSGSVGIIDPDAGLQLPARPHQDHRRRAVAGVRQRPGGSRRIAALSRQRRLRGLLLAVSAQRAGFPRLGRTAAGSSCST